MTPAPTLRETLLPQARLAHKAGLVALGSLFIALAAKVSVPLWPAPMTLQTLAILIVGFSFGSRLGAVTVLAYLAEGLAGLPVFTPTTAMGPAAFVGPTAGFLVGFVPMAWLAGVAAERGLARGLVGTAVSAVVISAMLYVVGLAWPLALAQVAGVQAGWAGLSLPAALSGFVMPFVPGDLVKALLSALIVSGGWSLAARR